MDGGEDAAVVRAEVWREERGRAGVSVDLGVVAVGEDAIGRLRDFAEEIASDGEAAKRGIARVTGVETGSLLVSVLCTGGAYALLGPIVKFAVRAIYDCNLVKSVLRKTHNEDQLQSSTTEMLEKLNQVAVASIEKEWNHPLSSEDRTRLLRHVRQIQDMTNKQVMFLEARRKSDEVAMSVLPSSTEYAQLRATEEPALLPPAPPKQDESAE